MIGMLGSVSIRRSLALTLLPENKYSTTMDPRGILRMLLQGQEGAGNLNMNVCFHGNCA